MAPPIALGQKPCILGGSVVSAKRSPMKSRQKKFVLALSLGLASYCVLYFMSVRTNLFESHDQVVPTPYYRPFDGDLVHAVFGPAHLVDAAYIRPAHWEPRSVERKHVLNKPLMADGGLVLRFRPIGRPPSLAGVAGHKG